MLEVTDKDDNKQEGDSLETLKGKHSGRRAFIIGNGPSLTTEDLDLLKEEITFASNKIYLAYDATNWRPTYYTVCDHLVAKNNAEMISNIETTSLFPSSIREFGCSLQEGCWYEERFENAFISKLEKDELEKAKLFFSRDAKDGIHGGYTVIYHQLQLAYHLGIREVYLIGVDFSFQVPVLTASDDNFKSDVYSKQIVSQGEVNHFHKDYRKPGETWSAPRLELQQQAFTTAQAVFEESGGFLINASRRTELKHVPMVDLDDVISSQTVDYEPVAISANTNYV